MTTDFSRFDNAHRTPLRRRFTATTQPLTVTGTLASWADGTPNRKRPHDARSSKGRGRG